MDRIYLDHAATTPMLSEVAEAMQPWLNNEFGNPSSLYKEGRKAKEAIDAAREVISDSLGCLFGEILFTSGGTEAANTAILGTAFSNTDSKRNRILMGASEHHCVLYTEEVLTRLGYIVEKIPTNKYGLVELEKFSDMMGEDVLLVTVMHANNELGTINQIRQLADLAHEKCAIFHTDTVQTYMNPLCGDEAFWKVADLGADIATVSAHKIYGPKGTGAIYLKAGIKIKPLVHGGGQEREMRGGTENLTGIVGFARAVEYLKNHGSIWDTKFQAREAFLETLKNELESGYVVSVENFENTLPGHLHMRFPGISSESLLIVLDRMGVCASAGAACSSGSIEPSHVLLACGYQTCEAQEGMRFTFGIHNTIAESKEAASRVAEAVLKMRGRIKSCANE